MLNDVSGCLGVLRHLVSLLVTYFACGYVRNELLRINYYRKNCLTQVVKSCNEL